jgi:PAS domain S-box-containing protein
MGQTRETSMGMAGVTVVALIICALTTWLMVDQAISAQKVGGEAEERPALFLGNESLPPMNFMKHGKPTGIVVDLAKAMAERMHRPAEIQLMKWTEAQQLVLDGRADALLQIDPNPERLKIYDFSDPLLNTEFTIFTSAERLGIASISNLRGLKVGVEEKGLPIFLLQGDPQIILAIIPDFVQGFRMLATGALDAIVADRWVGSYVLAENNIRGVKLIEEPIGRSHSAIAVKKGNTNLLGDINSALADIRRDGTYDRIIKSWRSKEVVFKTREQLRQQAWFITGILAALIAALCSIAALVIEIRRRKRADAALRESESRLDLSLRSSEMGVWYLDLVENKRYFDDRVCHLLGLDPAEFIGKAEEFFNSVHPQDRDAVKSALARSIEHGVPYEPEYRTIWPDGSIHHIAARGKLVYDNEGRPIRLNGLIWDITERRQAEAALRESEERFRVAQELSPDGFSILRPVRDADGLVVDFIWVYANPELERIVGMPLAALAGRSLLELFPGHRDSPFLDLYRQVADTGQTGIQESLYHGDGVLQERWFRVAVVALGQDIAVLSQDVTKRKLAEDALRESETRFRSLFENMTEGVALHEIIYDDRHTAVDYRVLATNPAFAAHTGLQPEQINGQLATAAYGTDEAPFLETYARVAETGQPVSFDTLFQPMQRHFNISASSPQPGQFVTVFEDITVGKRMEEDLWERTAQLEAANKELEAFSYSVSHDLKTPLRAIEGFSRMLLGEHAAKLDAEVHRLLKVITDNTQLMNHLVDDLLTLSRLGRKAIKKGSVNLSSLAQQVFDRLREQMPERDLQLNIGDLPQGHGDQSLLHQVMENLLSNAIKFTKSRKTAVIEVGVINEENETIYYVKDNGIGFDERYAGKLFGVFQRMHNPTEYEGTGVGLAIVKRIIERHGGRVWAEGKVNKGAIFHFTLPKK